MTRVVFWLSALVVLYVYIGYPVLLAAWGRIRPKPVHPHFTEPPVSVILAVRDEAEALERKIANLRSLDYPASHLQIVVVCDGRKAIILENVGDEAYPDLRTKSALAAEDASTAALGTDRPGRVHQRFGEARSAVEQTEIPAASVPNPQSKN